VERRDSVQRGYDRWAPVYDHDGNPLVALEEPLMKEAVRDVRGLDVLDLGCGTGRHSEWLARAGANVTAVDFSLGMLERAGRRTHGLNVRLVVHDLHEPLPFPNAAFDVVVSGLVIEHLTSPRAFFTEIHRVLEPGGTAVVSAMHPAMALKGTRARFTDPETGEVVEPGSHPHQLGDFVMAALGAGFVLERISERAPDAELAARYPRAEKYVGWPMLVVLEMKSGEKR
jgi:malonyl-CoA O-methyltransferase